MNVLAAHPLPLRIFLLALALALTACASSDAAEYPAEPDDNPCSDCPTLDDFWDGAAEFQLTVQDTGLPMGESDTVILADGTFRSYVHASYESAGVVDSCGDPVAFPGCVIALASADNGRSFTPKRSEDGQLSCMIPCQSCPCDSKRDHIDQQQYPRVWRIDGQGGGRSSWLMAYEYRGSTFLRTSTDGLAWSDAAQLPNTGVWQTWLMPCTPEETIGQHPYAANQYDCLVGGPPGLLVTSVDESGTYAIQDVYVFVAQGQNPSSMGCYVGRLGSDASLYRKCDSNPLFTGAETYGDADEPGADANAHFDFRTISSADVVKVDDRYYMFYEGVRGPASGDAGDTQFALGLARSASDRVDGQWDTFAQNPILLDLPGNVGAGHADVVVYRGLTILYTTIDGERRSRFELVWK